MSASHQHYGSSSAPLALQPVLFNPFAAQVAKIRSSSDSGGSPCPSPLTSIHTSNSGTRRCMPIASAITLLRGDNSSGSRGNESSTASEAQLRQLSGTAPLPAIISPARLSLEQSPGGRLVLLGKGSSALVFRAWLEGITAATDAAVASVPVDRAGAAAGSALATTMAAAAPAAGGDRSSSGIVVAAKILGAGDVKAFLQEASILQRLREHSSGGSDCVVALHGVCVASGTLVVVMECVDVSPASLGFWGPLCAYRMLTQPSPRIERSPCASRLLSSALVQGGDLRTALSGSKPPRWGAGGRQIAIDIAAGLVCLHAHNVTHRWVWRSAWGGLALCPAHRLQTASRLHMHPLASSSRPLLLSRTLHRDLKSKNVLLTSAGRAKVADVGTAALHTATYLSSRYVTEPAGRRRRKGRGCAWPQRDGQLPAHPAWLRRASRRRCRARSRPLCHTQLPLLLQQGL